MKTTVCAVISTLAPGLLPCVLQAGCWLPALALLAVFVGAVAWREWERGGVE